MMLNGLALRSRLCGSFPTSLSSFLRLGDIGDVAAPGHCGRQSKEVTPVDEHVTFP